jgi:hypothetical protein
MFRAICACAIASAIFRRSLEKFVAHVFKNMHENVYENHFTPTSKRHGIIKRIFRNGFLEKAIVNAARDGRNGFR